MTYVLICWSVLQRKVEQTALDDAEREEESLRREAIKGYECSIRLKNSKVVLRDGTDMFSGKAEAEEWFVSQMQYERIVISGKDYLSIDAISLLSQKNINVILSTTTLTSFDA